MKRFLLPVLLAYDLNANGMAAILIFPENGGPAVGVYAGAAFATQTVRVSSTRAEEDGRRIGTDAVLPRGGLFVGIENDRYRIDVSYDRAGNGDLRTERLLFNADFRFGGEHPLHPLLGIGVGQTDSRFDVPGRTLTFTNGTWALRGGLEYRKGGHYATLLAEYSRFLNAGSDSYLSDDTFTSYDLDEQHSFFIGLQYHYRFRFR